MNYSTSIIPSIIYVLAGINNLPFVIKKVGMWKINFVAMIFCFLVAIFNLVFPFFMAL